MARAWLSYRRAVQLHVLDGRRQQQLVDNVTAKFDQLGAPTVVVNTITVERLAPPPNHYQIHLSF